ncbi:MAG: DUF5320 domain-containing protein [Bacteroidales bacterium]|nr:DUF5320 domain-containing protein [Bacteroidales bacterium]
MPAGDRTGPMGQGPMTGRKMGFCQGNDNSGRMNNRSGFGRGMGLGRGFGAEWCSNIEKRLQELENKHN